MPIDLSKVQWDSPTPEGTGAGGIDLSKVQWDGPAAAGDKSYTLTEVPAAMLRNTPANAVEAAKGIYHAVTHPIDTAATLTQAAGGGVFNLLPKTAQDYWREVSTNPAKLEENIQIANAIGGVYKTRYGSWDAIKRTFAERPVDAMMDLSTVLSGAGVAVGGVGKTGNALRAANTAIPGVNALAAGAETVGKLQDPFNVAAQITNPLAPVGLAVQPFAKRAQESLAVRQQANAVRDANVARAQDAGYIVTPGSLDPSGKNIVSERIAGKTHLEQLASTHNQSVTDRLVREALGMRPGDALTPDTMKAVRASEYTKGYEPIAQSGGIPTDAAFASELNGVLNQHTGAANSFPGAVPDEVAKLVAPFRVGQFDAGDAVKVIRTLRDDANANFSAGKNSEGKARIAVANALEDQIERGLAASGNPDAAAMLQQFRDSRQRMAISHTVEDALRKGTGSLEVKHLAKELQRGRYMTDELLTAAEFANAFPRVNQPSAAMGTPGAISMLGGGVGGLLSAAAASAAAAAVGGWPGAAAGLAAAVTPSAVSGLLRHGLLSKGGTPAALPNYAAYDQLSMGITNPRLRNYLLTTQAANAANQNALNQ